MKQFEFTVNVKPHGPLFCVAQYSSIEKGEYHSEFGYDWKVNGPHVEDIELLSVECLDSPDLPPGLKSDEAKLILEYAENLILAGERL